MYAYNNFLQSTMSQLLLITMQNVMQNTIIDYLFNVGIIPDSETIDILEINNVGYYKQATQLMDRYHNIMGVLYDI